MGFDKIIENTFSDFKNKLKIILKTYLWLNIAPFFLLVAAFILLAYFAPAFLEGITNLENIPALALILIVYFFFFIWLALCIYYISLNKEKSFKITAKKSIKYFVKFAGLWIALAALFIPLILIFLLTSSIVLPSLARTLILVLALILIALSLREAIYWTFAVFILFEEKKSVLYSIKKSRKIIKGKWIKIFFYLLLMLVVLAIVYTLSELIRNIILLAGGFFVLVDYALYTAVNIVLTSLSILYMKNIYSSMKN